jgi:serine/threonine-protein kinase
MADKSSLVEEINAWLATQAVHDTLAQSLDDTIVPGDTDHATTGKLGYRSQAGERAVALLHEVAGASPTSTAQLQQGEVIAEGGMGVIRAGYQVSLGRPVAIKTLRPDRRGGGSAIDLLREAWVTGAIEHPNVVPVHYVGIDDDGQPVIVLKRIAGVEWSELIADADTVRQRFGTSDLLAWNVGILMQLLNALRFAHARGIVHRDLKPANVMIGEFGEVYLLDWGIAVSLREDEMGRLPLASRATEMAGTPVYMAPEMLGREGSAPLSERTDIYLAGAVLFEIIAGRPPHEGNTVVEVITSVVRSQPELPADTPAELARICARAMQADPSARFASVEDMRLALVAYLEQRGSTRLLEVASERLARLLEAIDNARAGTAKLDDEIHGLFGACRFGFHEALAVWRDNADAIQGLVRATSAVAEHELAAGDPRAAVALLSELAEPPPELMARARRAAADQATRNVEAERLRRQHDLGVGARTRTLIMAIMGTLFTAVPLTAALAPDLVAFSTSYATHIAWSLGFFVLVAGFGIWARESMMSTVLNRRAFVAIEALFVGQILLCAATWRLGISLTATEVLLMFVWVVMSGMAALTLDRRLTPGFVGYLIAFVIAVQAPERRYLIMAAANLAFTITAVYHWWPKRKAQNVPL